MTGLILNPWRLDLQKEFCKEFLKITPANGFNFDLTAPVQEGRIPRISRGRRDFPDDAPLPLISLLEDVRPHKLLVDTDSNSGTTLNYKYNLIVQGWVDDDFDHPTDPAHLLMADCKKIIANLRDSRKNSNYLLDFDPKRGRVTNVGQGAGNVCPPDEDSDKAYFWLEAWLDVFEFPLTPYKIEGQ